MLLYPAECSTSSGAICALLVEAKKKTCHKKYKPFGRSSRNAFVSEAGDWRFKSRAVKLDTVLPTAATFSSKEAVLPRRNDAKMGPANSLHASA